MSERIPIVVRAMLLCERVKVRHGIHTLVNPLTSIVMPSGVKNKLQLDALFVYTQLVGGLGRCNLSVQVRAFDSGYVFGRSQMEAVDFPSQERDLVIERVFVLRRLVFQRPGLYEFQVFANYLELDRGAVYLSVFPGD